MKKMLLALFTLGIVVSQPGYAGGPVNLTEAETNLITALETSLKQTPSPYTDTVKKNLEHFISGIKENEVLAEDYHNIANTLAKIGKKDLAYLALQSTMDDIIYFLEKEASEKDKAAIQTFAKAHNDKTITIKQIDDTDKALTTERSKQYVSLYKEFFTHLAELKKQ